MNDEKTLQERCEDYVAWEIIRNSDKQLNICSQAS